MSAAAAPLEDGDRLLMFLFEDVQYALPIAWVLEVAEKGRVTSVLVADGKAELMLDTGERLPMDRLRFITGNETPQGPGNETPLG